MIEEHDWEDCGRTADGKIIIRPIVRLRPDPPPISCLLCGAEKPPHTFLFPPVLVCWDCSHRVRGNMYLRMNWLDDAAMHMAQVVIAFMEDEIAARKPKRGRAAGRPDDSGVQPGQLHQGSYRRPQKASVW